LGEDLTATILTTAEYTNDLTLLVEGENCRLLNETDCKLGYADLRAIGEKGIDIGFYMFSGANWYPMMYDYPAAVQRELASRRRESLLRSFIQLVKARRPEFAVHRLAGFLSEGDEQAR
jgi:UDP-MurNAc hydroxylase